RGRRTRIRRREQRERQGRISLRRPRQLQLRAQLRPAAGQQRLAVRQRIPRRTQRAVLTRADRGTPAPWSAAPGRNRSARRLGGAHRRHPRGEVVEPRSKPRMILAPALIEPEVAVSEGAGERDLTNVRWRVETGWLLLERGEGARDLAGLVIEPFWLVTFRRPPARLVNNENRGIHDAIGQRLQPQRGKGGGGILPKDAAPTGPAAGGFRGHPA